MDTEESPMVTRGAEFGRCLELTGWSLNEAAKRMKLAPREAGDIKRGGRAISDPWLAYFQAVARLVSSVRLPTGEVDDPATLPPSLLLPSRVPGGLFAMPEDPKPEPGRAMTAGDVILALAESFRECQVDMAAKELAAAQTALMMTAERLGIDAALMEVLRKLPPPAVRMMSEADLADEASVDAVGGPVWRDQD